MSIVNTPKLIYASLVSVLVTVLMVTGAVDSAAGMPFLTAIGGYMLGNGVAAVQRRPVEPVLGPSDHKPDDPKPAGWSTPNQA